MVFLTGKGICCISITGVGGFVIEANKITGNNFTMKPKTGQTELHDNWGQASVELGSATIHGLVLSKNISLGGVLDQYGISNMDLMIASNGSTGGNNVKFGVTGIIATHSDFNNLKVIEDTRASHPLDVFSLQASLLTLDNPKLNTHFLSTAQIRIPHLNIDLVLN